MCVCIDSVTHTHTPTLFLPTMMLRSLLPLHSSSSTFLLESHSDLHCSRSSTVCCSSRNNSYIPKLEPFSRTKFDRAVKDPPLIQKSENELADYCCTLDGDSSYSCWRAYFELKDLEREAPKEDVERLILQAGGTKSLIGCLHGVAAISKRNKESDGSPKTLNTESKEKRPFPVPDGLPKSQEEIEEEENARMPDSPFTRMLRNKGRFPAWYSPTPDHETD